MKKRNSVDMPVYPKIPHLPFDPNLGEGDYVASSKEASVIFEKESTIYEKVDGAQCRLQLFRGYPILGSRESIIRKGQIDKKPSRSQFMYAFNWFEKRKHCFKFVNSYGHHFDDDHPAVIFGEWLYMRHGIPYDSLPDHFMPYDIWSTKKRSFLRHDKARNILIASGFIPPNVLYTGQITDYGQLIDFRDGASNYIKEGDRRREGIVIRCGDYAFKMVRPDFQRGRWLNDRVMTINLLNNPRKSYHCKQTKDTPNAD